jgi:amidase
MERRSFLKNTAAAAGITLAAATLPGCRLDTNDSLSEGELVLKDDFKFQEASIASLQHMMADGKLTAESLTKAYLERIAAMDAAGPELNAVIELNPDALSIAKAMDAERQAGKLRGPMHGIPVLVKDNIDTADAMQTTAGSLALSGNKAGKDAFIVEKLREAGAVLLGKTNLSEWANFRSTASSSGWSSRGGQTKCPYVLTHNPCGSSAGTGAAVAANFCVVGIGTETDGSVTCPASVNGLVGIKPTVGLWSRSGIIPISHTQDTAGPMARTVTDAAILLGICLGIDSRDDITKESAGKTVADYAANLNANSMQGKRIGVDLKRRSKHHQINSLLNKALDDLRKLGADIIEVDYVEAIEKLADYEYKILQYEFKDGVNKYLEVANAKVKSLSEVISFNAANEDSTMPFFKQETLELSDKLGGLESNEYKEALAKGRDGSRNILNSLISQFQLDAITGITMPPACAIDMMYGDRYSNDFLTQPAAMSGYPHITVPAGQIFGLPVGLSFFGLPYSEQQLIAFAYAYEQATSHRRPPIFLKTLPVYHS